MSLGFPGMEEFTCRWKITKEKSSPQLERGEERRSRGRRGDLQGGPRSGFPGEHGHKAAQGSVRDVASPSGDFSRYPGRQGDTAQGDGWTRNALFFRSCQGPANIQGWNGST